MKKFLLGLLVAAMFLGLTACSPEVSSKLGDTMGKMSNNIYGIKANMVQVDKATESVDNSVEKNESGNVASVNLGAAAEVMNTISSIKGSDQKRVALKANLSVTVSGSDDPVAAAAAAAAITSSAEAKKTALSGSTVADTNPQLKAALENALASVGTSLTDNPTKAELATVAVISKMADALMTEGISEEELASTGQAALDTLKVISDFGGIDLLADADVAGLISSLSGAKSLSRDEEEQAANASAKLYSTTLRKVVEMITEDKAFVEARYNSFILQAKAMKAAYEMISSAYITDVTGIDDYDNLFGNPIDLGLTIEDLIKYITTWLVVEIDTVVGSDLISPFMEALITPDNYDFLTNIENPAKPFNGEAVSDASEALLGGLFSAVVSDTTLEAFMGLSDTQNEIAEMKDMFKEMDPEMSDEEAGDQASMMVVMGYVMQIIDGVINDVSEFVAKATDAVKMIPQDFLRFVGTSVVIMVDAEWDNAIFQLAGVPASAGNKVSALLDNLKGMIPVFSEEEELGD
jgi:hypothetical protein